MTYKRDVGDSRESPARNLLQLLQAKGAEVVYHDPNVPTLGLDGKILTCTSDEYRHV